MDSQWRDVAVRWLGALEAAGLRDLPAQSSRQLPSFARQANASPATPLENESTATARRAAPAPPAKAETTGSPAEARSPEPAANLFDGGYSPGNQLERDGRVTRLAELARTVAACTRCEELARCRTQTVFGVGNPSPRLCFFGEAPGADEDRKGEPFVGRAGELLNRIIAACRMKREDVYILNTVKCRPPGNRNPADDELANCREYFEQQLEVLRPEFICCLGSVAAKALLETRESIGRLRGRLHRYKGSQVVVTYHPAYLLRNPAAKAATWEDMQLLMREMGVELP